MRFMRFVHPTTERAGDDRAEAPGVEAVEAMTRAAGSSEMSDRSRRSGRRPRAIAIFSVGPSTAS